jgi:hypothetical protein
MRALGSLRFQRPPPTFPPPPSFQVEAIYHTSIVVHGREIYYGQGVSIARPGRTRFGAPLRTLRLGETGNDAASVDAIVADAEAGEWTAARYALLAHNCNHFSAALCEALIGANRVPSDITDQPSLLTSTPFGQALLPALGGVEAALRVREAAEPATRAHPAPAVEHVAATLEAAVGGVAVADATAAAAPAAPAAADAAKAAFEAAVRREFDSLRAARPGLTPNEAAALAVEAAAAQQQQQARAAG